MAKKDDCVVLNLQRETKHILCGQPERRTQAYQFKITLKVKEERSENRNDLVIHKTFNFDLKAP